MGRLDEKVIIITGAGSGIGAQSAIECAKENATVIVTDINLDGANEVVAKITEAGGSALALQQDAASEERWLEVIAEVMEKYGHIDALVNNAGVSSPKNILELSTEEWKRIQDIDIDSYIFGMKHIIPIMQEQGGGSIINMSSLAGLTGMARTSPYTVAKSSMRFISKAAAADFGKDRIRVNTIHPGIIVTPMTESTMEQSKDYYHMFTQLPELGEPLDIAYGVVYLASDESKFITGTELVIDGGWTAV